MRTKWEDRICTKPCAVHKNKLFCGIDEQKVRRYCVHRVVDGGISIRNCRYKDALGTNDVHTYERDECSRGEIISNAVTRYKV